MLIDTVNALCRFRLGREPDLDNPTGFNDHIQWLKVHDQRPEHIQACDKWAARQMVPPENKVPAMLGVGNKWRRSVVKCTHDCGSVQFVERGRGLDPVALRRALARPYGAEKGEWAYKFIRPRVMTEKLIAPGITDYKFHCSHGEVRWCQVISERFAEDGPRETILSPDGDNLALHMDQNMRHVPCGGYPGDEAWAGLTTLARKLAASWRYVRVDLYWHGQAWFGELTFWPLAGCYLTADEPVFGEMLQLDLSNKLKPIVS